MLLSSAAPSVGCSPGGFGATRSPQRCPQDVGNLPLLGVWLQRVEALGVSELTEAIEGIWCDRDGRATMPVSGSKSMLCVGRYSGRVEFAYLS